VLAAGHLKYTLQCGLHKASYSFSSNVSPAAHTSLQESAATCMTSPWPSNSLFYCSIHNFLVKDV
jgi:hypothetical protein